MTKAQIEKTYGVKIRDDSFYNPRTGKSVKQYRIYSADGCQWENGLRSMADVERECKEWASELKEIAGKSMSENKKTLTKKNPLKEDFESHEVTVGFCGFIGVEETYQIWADSKADIANEAIEEAAGDLTVDEIEDLGDGEYDCHVGWNTFVGVDEVYNVYADDESDAEEQALELAKQDLDIIDIDGEPFSWDNLDESLKEDLENVEATDNTVEIPQPMAVAKEESEDLWKRFIDATEEPKDAPLFGAEDQPTPDEVEEPKAELEESLSSKLTLDEGLFENKKALKEGIKEEKAALREVQKQLRRLLLEIKDSQKSISSYAKGNGNYTNLIDDLYEARNGLLGAIDDIDNLIFEDHQLSSRRNESLKLKEGYSVVDLETGDRFGNYDDIEIAKNKAYRYATMFKAECAVINDRMRPVCGFRSNGREISMKGLGESFKKLKEANGADGQLFNGQKDIADSFKNYKAFKANFKPVHIVKVNGNYVVFNEDAQDSNSFIYYSNNKDNIEGWLYGAVQAKNKIIAEGLKKNKKSVKENFYLKTKNPKKKLNEAYITKDFDEFEPWSGAVEVWNRILDEDKLNDLEFFIDDVYNGVIGETELNDLLRFDSDYVYDVLGMSAEEDVDESLSKKKLKESFSQPELARWLEDSVNWLVENQEGCCTYKLDDRLAVCVGWEDGFDDEEGNPYVSNGYGIVAGIKVWTSDSMRTDYDWINAPYDDNGEVYDTTTSISPNENFSELADWLTLEWSTLATFELDKDGRILGEKDFNESLKKGEKRNLKEEVSDYAYELAAKIDKRFRDEGFISWEDFNEVYEDWFEYDKANLDDDQDLWELETDVRGILSSMGWETIFEGEDEGSLKLLESKKRANKRNLKEKMISPARYKISDVDWFARNDSDYDIIDNLPTEFEIVVDEDLVNNGNKDIYDNNIYWVIEQSIRDKFGIRASDFKFEKVVDENLKEASTLPKGGKDEDFDTDAWSVIYWELSANSEDSASTRNMKKLAKTSAKASDKYERVDPVNDSDLRVYAKDEDGFKLAKKVADAWKVKYEIEPTKKSHQANA